jgi:CheY-like chemotaxis protein
VVTQGRRGKTGLCGRLLWGKQPGFAAALEAVVLEWAGRDLLCRPGTASPCRVGTGARPRRYRPVPARPRQTAGRRRTRDRREGRYALNTGCPARSTGTAWPATGNVLARHGLCGESTGLLGFLLAAMRGACKFCNSVRMALGVLIVDDNRLFLEAARALLEREGLRVVGVAATSAEALQRAEELRPEVILVDIMLGGESGFDLARRLAAQCPGRGPAVILISTHAGADFADLIAESPAAGFVPKPELSADAIHRIVDGRAPGGPGGAPAR